MEPLVEVAGEKEGGPLEVAVWLGLPELLCAVRAAEGFVSVGVEALLPFVVAALGVLDSAGLMVLLC
jgi:hypothetical protein